jgi:hypothetical protein
VLLASAEPQIRDHFFFIDKIKKGGSSYYDLVVAPDYFTKLTATFDAILSLSLKSKLAHKNKMFLTAAISLAKLLRDMPKELSDIYEPSYISGLLKLSETVLEKYSSENNLERWTPPSLEPKLKK